MFSRFLLVQPPSSTRMGATRPPNGLGYIAETLGRNQIEYSIVDLRLRSRSLRLQKEIDAFQPDLIGVSMVSFNYERAYDVVREIKRYSPSAAIVVGGPHVTIMGSKVLADCPEIDFAIMQDGELPSVVLCKGELPLSEIPGLIYRENGAPRYGRPPETIQDLDAIPFPRYEGVDVRPYATEVSLITSRGCPYRCIFCPNSVIHCKFLARSAENVVDEIAYWYDRGVRQFNVDDDNFTLVKQRVYDICDQIEQRGLRNLFIRCANGVRADRVDRPLLERMRQVGVAEVGIAADGGNDRVLQDVVNKGETIAMIEQAIQDALAVGMRVKLFSVLGNPGETMSDIEDTFALVERYPILRAQLYNPIPYPGTELFNRIHTAGRFLMTPEEFLNTVEDIGDKPVFETPELPEQARIEILKRARKMEKAVTRRAVERMFHNLPGLASAAGWLFSTKTGQWLFFNNRALRQRINRIWYRKMVSNRAEQPAAANPATTTAAPVAQGADVSHVK